MVTKKTAGTGARSTARSAKATKRSAKSPKRVLARAEGPQCFWVNDGEVLADLLELKHALALMSGETFSYHVNGTRNDFADWIEFVLGDTELALALRGAKKPKQAHTIVVRRLSIYDLP